MSIAKGRKFSTFSGVFTPSFLTIVGVIMYLRLPTIVGQAGLIQTLGIILLAHVISVTTSLSIASLATDKLVRKGGPYYILSRSMGLPIGGTLGIALFTGFAFSVSLYLIGFAESFLHYWNLEVNINTIRLTGGVALVAITIITYISTSLALKSQFVIMAAIVLSLVSIFLGSHDYVPDGRQWGPLTTTAPFMVLFGIFFPAVTGFGAGISMSGDLKNAKRALPLGTLMAVGMGLIIYISLALFLSYTVDAKALASNPQILFEISWVPALVVAGIWGATISSAFGSILSAPRILQAIAIDKIAPSIFAKSSSKKREPRNALWIAFAIAAGGIMIGELDVIARIVSMFFITTYAFLNLAFTIESWASPDFRPAFRIPRIVSIVGALSAFIVMVLLDLLALAGATIVLTALYLYLRRKELLLESGDAWNSFWTNMAKSALLKLSAKKENQRNWRPNIVLFSGGEKVRPHLVELGLWLTGKLGALTDFELITEEKERIEEDEAPDRAKTDGRSGYFIRQLKCNTIAEGIKTVTSIYGFSGFEPNTVLLGWSKNSKNSSFLAEMIGDFKAKDLNAVFLDYDKEHGFGERKVIDIWWNGRGRHLTFSLNILRFLLSEPSWRDAKVRILVINPNTSLTDSIYQNTNALLNDKRISAEVTVLNDDFGSRSLDDIIKTHSSEADLIMLGLTQKSIAQTEEYIQKVNKICTLPASVLLLRPSFEFEVINFTTKQFPGSPPAMPERSVVLDELPDISNPLVKSRITTLDVELMNTSVHFCEQTISNVTHHLQALPSSLHKRSARVFRQIEKIRQKTDRSQYTKALRRVQTTYHQYALKSLESEYGRHLGEAGSILQEGLQQLLSHLAQYLPKAPEKISIPYDVEGRRRKKTVQFPFRKALHHHIESTVKHSLHKQLAVFEYNTRESLLELQSLFFSFNDLVERLISKPQFNDDEDRAAIQGVLNRIEDLERKLIRAVVEIGDGVQHAFRKTSITIAGKLSSIEALKQARKSLKKRPSSYTESVKTFAEQWSSGMQQVNSAFYLDVLIVSKKTLFHTIFHKETQQAFAQVAKEHLAVQEALMESLVAAMEQDHPDVPAIGFPEEVKIPPLFTSAYEKANVTLSDLPKEINIPEYIYNEQGFVPFKSYSTVSVNIHRTARHHIGTGFYEPLYREYESLGQMLKKATASSREAYNMLLFHLHNTQEYTDDELSKELNRDLFRKLFNQVTADKEHITKQLEAIESYTDRYINEAFSKLFYHSARQAGKNIRSEGRKRRVVDIVAPFSKLVSAVRQRANGFIIQVLNLSSSGVLLSKSLLEERNATWVQSREINELTEGLLPDPAIYNTIPVYYRDLMCSDSKIPDEFWVHRQYEERAISSALQKHKRGLGGAVIITGSHGSGKTALIRHTITHSFKPHNTLWIPTPEPHGNACPDSLQNAFAAAAGNNREISEILDSLPRDSAVVIDNMELWWERRHKGGEAILSLISIMKQYSHKVFFVIGCNVHALKAIQQVYPLGEHALLTIKCSPFNSEAIQQMIMKRHHSGGIPLMYKGDERNNISQLQLSLLFNKFFGVSEGNPEAALNTWIKSIKGYNGEFIEIRKPTKHHPAALMHLDPEQLVLIALMLQHKYLNAEQLSNITATTLEQAENVLVSASSKGFIVNNPAGYYRVEPNIKPLLADVCEKKGLL